MRVLNVVTDESQMHPTPAARHSILVADDDAEMRSLLASELGRLGYDVKGVATGAEVVNFFSKAASGDPKPLPELVVCDLRMAGFSGLQVLDAIRGIGSRVPFILITAFGDDWVREKAIRFGAMAVLDKPFELEELALLIGRLLERN